MKTRHTMSLAALALASGCAVMGIRQTAVEPFKPEFDSLKQYQCPEWFRDAKFGIWAHWGPQAVPMFGDWYAKRMYVEGDKKYQHHLENYGHPSKTGWKDIIPLWKAEKFDPDRLMALYKAAGARYFVSMGVHHDNFDLWNSKYHAWNAVQMGPHRDIVGAWQKAARAQGLKFGVSEHLGASFTWWQPSRGADAKGPLAGVPYDGADPRWQELYHPAAATNDRAWYSTDPRWAQEWLARITDLVDAYQPDLLYSDGALPFGETGCALLAHYYNASQARNNGKVEAVYCLKDWTTKPGHGTYVEGIGVQDVERGGLSGIKAAPWQTDTSIGDWFYNKEWKIKETGKMYRDADWVIRTLADVVSKNGNMLLNIVQRPDGAVDPEVEQLLKELAAWMAVNSEAIHGTRPWRVYGEGQAAVTGGAFKEDFGFTADDIRFTQSKNGRTLYAIALGLPTSDVAIRSLAKAGRAVTNIRLLGSAEKLTWKQEAEALTIQKPLAWPCKHAVAFKVEFEPEVSAVSDAMRRYVAQQEIAGAVTLVASPDRILHLGAVGHADVAAGRAERPDTIFWIASMTKPVTAAAVLMLQDEGKLTVDDPVAKYIPELAHLKTRDGKFANLTLKDLLTHTSGMAEPLPQESAAARTLADLIPAFASKPLQFEPRTKWQYCQSGINTLGRIVEVVSGQSLPDFFQKRLFGPLGMRDTTFYPNSEQCARLAKPYQREDGKLKAAPFRHGIDPAQTNRYPAANGGLFSTAPDYARFCQMLLNRGTLDGTRYLKPETVALMSSVHSGTLKTGFTDGNGWGLGVCVVREPQGVTSALSPGSFGHGGAFGTQAWVDPVRQLAYVLMVQRTDFPNSDASDVRRAFQDAAAAALARYEDVAPKAITP